MLILPVKFPKDDMIKLSEIHCCTNIFALSSQACW